MCVLFESGVRYDMPTEVVPSVTAVDLGRPGSTTHRSHRYSKCDAISRTPAAEAHAVADASIYVSYLNRFAKTNQRQ